MGALKSRYCSGEARLRHYRRWKEKTETKMVFLVEGDILSKAWAQIKGV